MKKLIKIFSISFSFILCILLILDFKTCKDAVLNGILVCCDVIIPSLFPFTVFLLFIIGTNIFSKLKVLSLFGRIFSLNSQEMIIFFLSLFSGYPTGAKMLCEAEKNGSIERSRASLLVCCCVNAGPAFIISAVGNVCFNSLKIGAIIFIAHILSSVILLLILKTSFKKNSTYSKSNTRNLSLADNFVNATTQASASIMNICFYVILFSVITAYLTKYLGNLSFIKIITALFEVTNGINNSRNIYLICFILGFSGICIWMQVFSVSGKIRPKISLFAIIRIAHGLLNSVFCFVLLKIFKIQISVSSKMNKTPEISFAKGFGLAAAILILAIFFIISVEKKKYSGNIVEDLL